MTLKHLTIATALVFAPILVSGQGQGGLDPQSLLKPLSDSWPTYSGDHTGRRFSALKQINKTTVRHLSLAWVVRLTAGAGAGGAGGRGGGAGAGAGNVIMGGVGTEIVAGPANVKGAILMVNDVLYVSAPDNVWALDARDGRELWHYVWRTRGGTHIGNRGVAIWHNYLFFETPDDYLVSLDAQNGSGALARRDRRFRRAVLLDAGADHRRQPRARRHGQRPRHAGIPAVVRPGNRQAPVEVLHGADEGRRSGIGHVAQPRRGPARWGTGLGSGRVRPGDQAVHLRHGQSHAGLHRRRAQGRQPLHLLACRRQRRHREDGVVLPDVRARYARLGFRADADPDRRGCRRQAAQARLDRVAQRLLLHRRSRDRRASRDEQVRHDDELGEGPSPERRGRAQSGEGGDDSWRAGVAGRGRRDQLAAGRRFRRTPACSTCTSATASTCST